MRFITYAQNFEDVMLWRALKHVENGFYIDIGANDPVEDSVTKAFYDQGWCGINVEPIKSHYQDLQDARPRDTNLCCAIGASEGELEIWEADIRGWATADKAVIQKHIEAGHAGEYRRVPVTTLAMLCESNGVKEVHFLKIDVEGFENDVLLSADFGRYRPWIVVVEATMPNSTIEAHEQWEEILLSARYVFAYADGLNRFYVADEHSELMSALAYPPNVFDQFVRWEQVSCELRAEAAEEQLTHAENRANLAEIRINQARIFIEQPLSISSQIQQNQDQIEHVLKVIEEVRTQAARIDRQYEDRTQQALKVAEEARVQAFLVDQHLEDRTLQAIKVAEEARTKATRIDQQYEDRTKQALHVAEEVRVQAIRIDQRLDDRMRQALQIAEEARAIAIRTFSQYEARLQETLKAVAEADAKTTRAELLNNERTEYVLKIAEEALAKANGAKAEGSLSQALIQSRSWRLTAPLRWCSYQVIRLRQDGAVRRAKAAVRKYGVYKLPRRLYNEVLKRFGQAKSETLETDIGSLSDLTPASDHIYQTLKTACGARKKR